jgi:restriction system protein
VITLTITVEAVRDVVRTYLIENFAGHKLTSLVAAILQAEGFTCDVSPPGPDYGVDILAGTGPLGLDSPTLVVEVKSENTQIGVPVLNQLKGALSTHGADQALLVAWGGLTKPAEELRRTQRLSIQVWTAEDLLDRLFSVYERLSDEMRARVPLKRTWILAVGETG